MIYKEEYIVPSFCYHSDTLCLLTAAFAVVHLEVCPVIIVDTYVVPGALAILEACVVDTGVVHSVSRNVLVSPVQTSGNFCVLRAHFWRFAG